jgi:hypothetical protein
MTRPVSRTSSHTWWGRAWVDALEQRAQLDPNRLPRGRTYAGSGAVGDLALAPGEVRAQVEGRRSQPYEVRIRVRRFAQDEWDRVLDAICTQLGHAAALLDGELPPEVADDVAAAGLDLLPGAGEVGPRCTCPDDADPCKHSAAVCYLVADALDADPFVVLLLRGRTREEVLAAPVPSGPIPVPPMPPNRPGHPAALPVDPPGWRRGLREDLLALAADTARRSWELAAGLSADAGLSLDPDADLARRAERALGTPAFPALAARSGVGERELARWALAWRHGGTTGFDVLRRRWDPVSEVAGVIELPGITELLSAAWVALRGVTGGIARISGDRVTAGGIQLRLGRDFQWYRYARVGGHWEPAGPPQPDPARAAQSLED